MNEQSATFPSGLKASTGSLVEPGSHKEWLFLTILTAIQVCHVLDFVIIMPLGPQFIRVFDIDPQRFGFMVSAYTFAAAIFGFLGAFVIDRFDRRTTLLVLYAGFAISTLLCALATNYWFLVAARIVAGAFGGTVSGVTFAIIGDAFSENRRGMATGAVMSAFSIASVIGIPLGLYLANAMSWHAPFYMLAGASLIVWVLAWMILPPMRGHLEQEKERESNLRHMVHVLTHGNYQRAYVLTIALMMAGFMVIPYISPYLVSNCGVAEKDLFYVYLVGGALNFFVARFIGRLADQRGKLQVFRVMAAISVVPIIWLTHLGQLSLPWILVCTTLFMMTMSGRFVPAMAMITSSVSARHRGSFMSVNSSVQQMGSGLAALVGGTMIQTSSLGQIENYGTVGFIASAFTLVALWLAHGLKREA